MSSNFIQAIGLELNTQLQLTEKDWDFKHPQGKKPGQVMGLAIDRHIRHYLCGRHNSDFTQPMNPYAPYDFMWTSLHFDIKSFSQGSVSISDSERIFADKMVAEGRDVMYMLFEQEADNITFYFRGYVSYAVLKRNECIEPSQFSGVFFRPNSSRVKRFIFS